MTMRKIHQNQDAPYLFTNLQLLCDGLIADSWLCGEDKAFRGRTGLICSAEQTGRILVTQNQAAHPPTTICRAGKLSSFSWWDKIQRKSYCNILSSCLPTLPTNSACPLIQVLNASCCCLHDRLLQRPGSRAPQLSHLAQRQQRSLTPATERPAFCLRSVCQCNYGGKTFLLI